jgi:neutral ceramidase
MKPYIVAVRGCVRLAFFLSPRVRKAGFISLAWTALAAGAAPVPAHPAAGMAWKAGADTVNITPGTNMWMAGFGHRIKPAGGKMQDLHAKALAFEHEQRRLVIVTLDLIGVTPRLRAAIAVRVSRQYGLPPESLLLNASHTHSGPEYRPRAGREQEALDYFAFLEEKLVQVIGGALGAMTDAHLEFSRARCGFAMNRRLPKAASYTNAPNPDGPVDHDVPVLIVRRPDRSLRAILFGYACHNTALSGYEYAGDYAGYAQEYLEETHSGVTAHFLNGCGGDQNPYPRRSGVVPGRTEAELTKFHGRALATAVEAALSATARPIRGPLKPVYDHVALDYADGRPPHEYPVQVVALGHDLLLVALGSEVVVDYSLRLKRELAGPAAVWVAAYSNDYSGYIPSLRVLKEGGYEAATGWAETIEERIVSKVHDLRRQVVENR